MENRRIEMSIPNDSERNNSIDIFRFISALLVIAIHTNPMTEINPYLGYLCSQICPRVAVPFFFCVSGYYYIGKLEKTTNKKEIITEFKKTFLSYLKIYFFWSVVYVVCDYKQYFYEGVSDWGAIIGIVLNFLVYGTYYHLWYFIGIFFSLIIVTLCYLIRVEKILDYFSVILYLAGVLSCAYYQIGNRIPIFSLLISSSYFTVIRRIILMALPFFMMGYFIPKISNKKVPIKLVLTGALFVGEIIVVNIFELSLNVIETVFLYVFLAYIIVWLVHHPLQKKKRTGKICRYLSSFIYFSHPLFLMIITQLGITENTIVFILTALFSTATGLILIKINNKTLNQFIA